MKTHFFFLIFLLSVCLMTACGSRTVSQDSDPSAILSAYVGDDHTRITVSHILAGRTTETALTGDSIAILKTWLNGLEAEARELEEGNAPGEAEEGGEVWHFTLEGGRYTDFSYVKSGPEEYWLYMEEHWYAVTNPSDPPAWES